MNTSRRHFYLHLSGPGSLFSSELLCPEDAPSAFSEILVTLILVTF